MSGQRSVELVIGGMTCASCAHRIERKLGKLDGVTATVNYATEKAQVSHPDSVETATLVTAVEAAGYTAAVAVPPEVGATGPAVDDPARALRTRVTVSAGLALPVVVLSMVPAWQFTYWQWIALALAAPVVVWGAAPFHRATWTNLRHGAASMDTLISLGTVSALGWSLYALLWGGAGRPGMVHAFHLTVGRENAGSSIYLEVAAGVTVFVLAGRWAEARSKRRAGAALRALLQVGAKEATVLRDGHEIRIAAAQLAVGEHFVVRPGETLAADGVVEQGRSALDTAVITGEAVPREVETGDAVVGGCINIGGRLIVRATRVGADTQLAWMGRLVEQAQTGKAHVQRLADRISGVFVPAVIVVAVATLGWWLGSGAPAETAFSAAVAVLIVACPCALGLATPTALLVGTGRGAQLGLLVRGPEVLESTRRVDTVVLDKTGTLTTGRMTLKTVVVGADAATDEDGALRLAASVEAASEHPVGRAIAAAGRLRCGDLPDVAEFDNAPGLGVLGVVSEVAGDTVVAHAVVVGRPELLAEHGIALPGDLTDAVTAARAGGETAVVVAWDGEARAVISVGDALAPGSVEAVARLRALGLRPVLLTGDHPTAARATADLVGIDEVLADVSPQDKVAAVRRWQAQGRVVAMVGDGVNDAAALATADLGIAMGTGTDAAIEASDLTLVHGDLRAAPDAIRLARATLGVIRGNLFWAFAYNVAALPLAASGLLNPLIAGAAMAASSVFVVGNSLRLRTFRVDHRPAGTTDR